MYSKIHIQNLYKTTLQGNCTSFEVCYINATDGRSYTAYPTTPGYNALKNDIDIVVYYRINVKNGKTYYNVTNITNEVQREDGVQLLKDIRELLQNILVKIEEKNDIKKTIVREPVPVTKDKKEQLPFLQELQDIELDTVKENLPF